MEASEGLWAAEATGKVKSGLVRGRDLSLEPKESLGGEIEAKKEPNSPPF